LRRQRFTNACAGWVRAALAALVLCAAAPAAAGPIDLRVEPVPLNPDDPSQATIGGLDYLGGFVLSSNDEHFGGLSGLDISPDGAMMTAVSDRGKWFTARLVHDDGGVLVDITDGAIFPIRDEAGHGVAYAWNDAEEVARLADGALAVSFERRHRIWIYSAGASLDSALPHALPEPPGLAAAPYNGGIEALTQLADGHILAVTERDNDGATRVHGWILSADGKDSAALSYAVAHDFRPTAFTTLDNGDVLALERRFNLIDGAGARLMRIPAREIVPGAVLTGREIARLHAPLTVDNFEGLDVRRGPDGAVLVYIISDDNFKLLQRTLLLQFRLRD
jgi:hypothetical protein